MTLMWFRCHIPHLTPTQFNGTLIALMKDCWDPEFEPSVEDIMDYPMISLWRFSQLAFSSELAFRAGGFPYSVEHVAGEGQGACHSTGQNRYLGAYPGVSACPGDYGT